MKRSLCILMAMVMVFCLLPMTVTATSAVWDGTVATAYAGGTGTELDPYQIANGEQLAFLAQQVSAGTDYSGQCFVMTDDIVLNDTTDWQSWDTTAPENTWVPIGSTYSPKFAGIFDGNNHTISGLYTDVEIGAGLFYHTGPTSTIKNLGIRHSYFKGAEMYSYAGSIAITAEGSIRNCYNAGIVTGCCAGGIAGKTEGSPIFESCYNEGTVKTNAESGYAGGICGKVSTRITISNCQNVGTISSLSDTGYAGGLAGEISGLIQNSYNSGSVTGAVNKTGLIGGRATRSTYFPLEFSGCYYLDDATSLLAIGEFYEWSSSITTYNQNLSGTAPLTDAQMRERASFAASWDFVDVWTMEGDPNYLYPELRNMPAPLMPNPDNVIWTGTGTELDPYIIMTLEQLAYFRDQVNGGRNFEGQFVKLGANLTMNDVTDWRAWSDTNAPAYVWTPIGVDNAFSGTFDGDNHTISGIYVNHDYQYVGLFGYATTSSTIKNLGVINSYIEGNGFVGAIAGTSRGPITNCYNTGTVVGFQIGGICGRKTAGTVAKCWNSGAITGTSQAGGLVGFAELGATIINSFNAGTVSTPTDTGSSGGLVGNFNGDYIQSSYNAGRVIGAENGTGLISGQYNSNTTYSDTYYLDDATTLTAIGNTAGPTGTAPLTDAQMRVGGSFSEFDFTDVWTMEGDPNYLYPELRNMPAPQLITLTISTLGGAARYDKTAIRFGASVSFEDMEALNVGDTVDYGFSINGLRNDALTNANWMRLSAASNAVSFTSFTWTAEMDAATSPEALAAAIRATGIKVYGYDAYTITFAIIINNLPMAAQDSLWVFEPYVTINTTDISFGQAMYTSVNRILGSRASDDYLN